MSAKLSSRGIRLGQYNVVALTLALGIPLGA